MFNPSNPTELLVFRLKLRLALTTVLKQVPQARWDAIMATSQLLIGAFAKCPLVEVNEHIAANPASITDLAYQMDKLEYELNLGAGL